MKSIKTMTIGELAAYVCSHLKSKDIDVTLTGGGCVSIYTGNDFVSYDLDFIETLASGRRPLIKALGEIGFKEQIDTSNIRKLIFSLNFQPDHWLLVMNHHPQLLI